MLRFVAKKLDDRAEHRQHRCRGCSHKHHHDRPYLSRPTQVVSSCNEGIECQPNNSESEDCGGEIRHRKPPHSAVAAAHTESCQNNKAIHCGDLNWLTSSEPGDAECKRQQDCFDRKGGRQPDIPTFPNQLLIDMSCDGCTCQSRQKR